MTPFAEHLAAARRRLDALIPLALVPVAATLVRVEAVERVATGTGRHFGISASFPLPVPDLWTFVSLPSPAAGVHVEGSPVSPLVPLVQAALAAAYVGGIHQVLSGRRLDPVAAVRERFVPFLLFVGVLWAVILSVGALAAATRSLVAVAVAVPLLLAIGYLFYAAPFLFVTEDRSFLAGLARSAELALGGGDYARFAVVYFAVVLVASVPMTVVAVNAGVVGLLVGTAATAPLSLLLTAATVSFVDDLGDGGAASVPGDS